MTVLERVAYLKGLFEGLEIDTGKKEGKLYKGMLETMEELAQSVADLQEQNNELLDEMDDIYEELSAITEDFLDEEEEELGEDETLYQVICPTCGEVTYLDEEMLAEGSTSCAACGEELEFDLTDLAEEPEEE
ncbi:MAG: hypothetical protein KH319_07215 [Butyricicoccus pullicaecorum]|nr:hypothetical protein [Butyricicoccus pullicaecorum]